MGRLFGYGTLNLDSAAQRDQPLSTFPYLPDVAGRAAPHPRAAHQRQSPDVRRPQRSRAGRGRRRGAKTTSAECSAGWVVARRGVWQAELRRVTGHPRTVPSARPFRDGGALPHDIDPAFAALPARQLGRGRADPGRRARPRLTRTSRPTSGSSRYAPSTCRCGTAAWSPAATARTSVSPSASSWTAPGGSRPAST